MTKRIDLAGKRYGRWLVLAHNETRSGVLFWQCRCDCGTEKMVNGLSLRDGRSTSCGCRKRDWRRTDLTGQVFGMLTALLLAEIRNGRSYWRCRCECGKEKIVLASSLVYGSTKSCGRCALIIHGEASPGAETTEYRSWSSMMSRCNNPNHDSWASYGGRGIGVCDRWRSYRNFLADMGRKPTAAHSIERVDVNGNYDPANCRWATKKEQVANRRPFKTGRIESFTDAELMAELRRRGRL